MSNAKQNEKENLQSYQDSKYIYRRGPDHIDETTSDDKFEVIMPKTNLAVLIIIFVALFLAQFFYFSGIYLEVLYPETMEEVFAYEGVSSVWELEGWFYWWAPLVFLGLSVIIILSWGEIGSRLASTSIVKYLRKTVARKFPKPTEIILGYPIRTKDLYYLEAYPVDLDLGSNFAHTKTVLKRVMEVVSISLGMSVIIAQVVAPFLWGPVYAWDPELYWNVEEMIIDLTLYMGPLTLLILMFVMPIFWISEDTQAYRIDRYHDTHRLGYYLRTGLLSKILGFFGIVLVFNLAQDFATSFLLGEKGIEYSELMASPALAIELGYTTLIWFGLIVLMGAAIPFLVSVVYLSFFHEKWVNNVRIRASDFMDLGTLTIRKPKKDNLEYMENPEKIDESGIFEGFFQTRNGRLILYALIIGAALVCIYLGFIYGFEPAFGWT
ncbi:MAG: hypothetical protein R6U96_10300 [Promethearchaeia archaeon]